MSFYKFRFSTFILLLCGFPKEATSEPSRLSASDKWGSFLIFYFLCVSALFRPSWARGWTSTLRTSGALQTTSVCISSSLTFTSTSPARTWSAVPATCWPTSTEDSSVSLILMVWRQDKRGTPEQAGTLLTYQNGGPTVKKNWSVRINQLKAVHISGGSRCSVSVQTLRYLLL